MSISVSLFTLISCLGYLVIKKDLLLSSIIVIFAFITLILTIYYTTRGILIFFNKVFNEDSNSILRTNKYIHIPIEFTVSIFIYPLYILIKIFEFINKMIVSFYKRSCPLIKWI